MVSDLGQNLAARLVELSRDAPGLTRTQIAGVESALRLDLPEAVVEGIEVWPGGESLGGIEIRSWQPEAPASWSIVAETLRLRKTLAWRPRFILLAEHADSVVVLDVVSGQVAWFDSVVAPLLDSADLPTDRADVWPNYLRFLLALCDMEAEERDE